jgi:hypothetical protein
VIDIKCRLNRAEKVLLPSLLETYLWLIVRSIFAQMIGDKHTGTIVYAGKYQWPGVITRQATYRVGARGKCLSIYHKLEREFYNDAFLTCSLGYPAEPRTKAAATKILAYFFITSPLNV